MRICSRIVLKFDVDNFSCPSYNTRDPSHRRPRMKPDLESRFPRPSQWLLLAIAVGIGLVVAALYWVLMRFAEMMNSQPL